MEKGDYKINDIYEPGYGKFHPSKDIPTIDYKIPSGQLGITTDPRTGNQLAELSSKLNTGVVPIEVGALMSQTAFDSTPIQHFTEMKRKAKLAEAKVSLHAPVDGDPSGFTRQGWDETKRQQVERQLMTAMDKAYLLDDKENVPVTIHGSATGGSNWTFEGEGKDRKKVHEMMIAVDRETGELKPLKEEERFYPGGDVEKKRYHPEEQLGIANDTRWSDELDKISFQKVNVDNVLSKLTPEAQEMAFEAAKDEKFLKGLGQRELNQVLSVQSAHDYVKEMHRSLNANFSKAYKYLPEEKKKELDKLSQEFGKNLEKNQRDIRGQANAIQMLTNKLKEYNPEILQPIEDFSVDKASETFSNVAWHSYNKYKDKSPIVSIENLYPEMGFSQAKDLKNLIVKSRERFVEKAMGDGLSESKAKKAAEKVIGATFDVGHLNMNRKHGFKDEDMAKEAKEIAKYVKHVHLTDNFGYSDSHLPLGMGNVPVKEIMENLGEAGSKARKINEVGGWFEHFKSNPFGQILEAAGSPIYSSGEGPYWSQRTGFQQGYMEGYGMMLPQSHYEQFGAGFSRLPSSLGGSTQQGGGAGGRMGGGRE